MGAADAGFPRSPSDAGPTAGDAASRAGVSPSAGVDPTATGRVLRLQRLSTEDGPGLRTTAFLKGCGLACSWCHNPESLSLGSQIQWLGVGCLACGLCVEACPEGALSLGARGIVIDRESCTGCGACAEECPSGALEILGKDWSPGGLVDELEKDRSYFEASGGGITLSGGEASLQPVFSREVLRIAKERGMSTALDTCGFVQWKGLESLLPLTDIVLYDLKIMDPDDHRRLTGADNRRILENLLRITEGMKEPCAGTGGGGRPEVLWIRTPVVPGATDSERNIREIGGFIAEELGGCVDRWELCAFNNLCADKYARLGMGWDFADVPLMEREAMEGLATAAKEGVGNGDLVVWSGAVRD